MFHGGQGLPPESEWTRRASRILAISSSRENGTAVTGTTEGKGLGEEYAPGRAPLLFSDYIASENYGS